MRKYGVPIPVSCGLFTAHLKLCHWRGHTVLSQMDSAFELGAECVDLISQHERILVLLLGNISFFRGDHLAGLVCGRCRNHRVGGLVRLQLLAKTVVLLCKVCSKGDSKRTERVV